MSEYVRKGPSYMQGVLKIESGKWVGADGAHVEDSQLHVIAFVQKICTAVQLYSCTDPIFYTDLRTEVSIF